MKICLYDDVSEGHHDGYLDGLTRALSTAGMDVLACSPTRPRSLATKPANSWFEVSTVGLRQVRQGRRQLERIADLCQANNVDSIWELNLDKNIWALPPALRRTRTQAHVLHHVHQYTFAGRSPVGKARTAFLRGRLARLAGRGARLVVHTERARQVLSEFVPAEKIIAQPYPVISVADSLPSRKPGPSSDSPRLLFVGQARAEKGLQLLLETLKGAGWPGRLDIVGKQDPKVRSELETRYASDAVNWIDHFVDDENLMKHYARASLLVLPYRTSFGRDGGASGVLLEGLRSGIPILATSALADQLPPGYPGAVVAVADETDAFRAALELSLDRLADLQSGAREIGPAFIVSNHTYEAYVAGLLALVE